MIRTSIVLSPALHQQLLAMARQAGKGLSEFLREQLGRIAAETQRSQLDEMYAAIKQMRGMIHDADPNASTTIDEDVYGKQGAWRGTPTAHGLWQIPQRKKNT